MTRLRLSLNLIRRQGPSPVSDLRGRELSADTSFWNDRTQQSVRVFARQGRAEGASATERPACKR